MKTSLGIAALVAVVGVIFWMVGAELDRPIMYKSTKTGACVKILAPSGELPCSSMKENDRFSISWVQ